MKDSKKTVLEYALKCFNLTETQLFLAKEIFNVLDKYYDISYPLKPEISEIKKTLKKEYNFDVTDKDIDYVLRKLNEDLNFIDEGDHFGFYEINFKGREMLQSYNNDFINYVSEECKKRIKEQQENDNIKRIQDQINNLTIKDLKGSIFQSKNAILFIIFTAVISAILSFFVLWIINKMGLY